ncbi:hypothetical protein F5X96DRAFT_397571 [Biscogniauxia mediterranea]|nr:hypothetical protein F5X96DRAFT_397571 [Biscogniauxia mediterranea]
MLVDDRVEKCAVYAERGGGGKGTGGGQGKGKARQGRARGEKRPTSWSVAASLALLDFFFFFSPTPPPIFLHTIPYLLFSFYFLSICVFLARSSLGWVFTPAPPFPFPPLPPCYVVLFLFIAYGRCEGSIISSTGHLSIPSFFSHKAHFYLTLVHAYGVRTLNSLYTTIFNREGTVEDCNSEKPMESSG